MSWPHHPARKSTAPTVRNAPTLFTENVVRTFTSVCWMGRAPSGDVTLSVSGNVPELRVSTVNRTVVLRGGRSRTRSFPSGNTSLSLARRTRTRSACPVSLRNVTGIAPFSAVSVIVLSTAGTRRRPTNWLTSASIFASSARARERPPGPDHTDDSDTSSDRLPGSATGFGGGTSALKASSCVWASRYSRTVTGAGGKGLRGGERLVARGGIGAVREHAVDAGVAEACE